MKVLIGGLLGGVAGVVSFAALDEVKEERVVAVEESEVVVFEPVIVAAEQEVGLVFEKEEVELDAKVDDLKVAAYYPFENKGKKAVILKQVFSVCPHCLAAGVKGGTVVNPEAVKQGKESAVRFEPGEKGVVKAVFGVGTFTERSCMIEVKESSGRFHPTPVWYRELAEGEVETTVCNRSESRHWVRSIYRIYGDFFQWVNLLDRGSYSFIYKAVAIEGVPEIVMDAYLRGLKHIDRIENSPVLERE